MTECNRQGLLFQDLGRRKVVADFDGGTISSDAGALILRKVEIALGISPQASPLVSLTIETSATLNTPCGNWWHSG